MEFVGFLLVATVKGPKIDGVPQLAWPIPGDCRVSEAWEPMVEEGVCFVRIFRLNDEGHGHFGPRQLKPVSNP